MKIVFGYLYSFVLRFFVEKEDSKYLTFSNYPTFIYISWR